MHSKIANLAKLTESAKIEATSRQTRLLAAKARLSAFQESVSAFGDTTSDPTAAALVRRLQDKVKKEQQEISTLEAMLIQANGRCEAFEEALKLTTKDPDESELRAGSQMFEVREFLRAIGQPQPLDEILKAVGFEGDEKKRNSLRGSLASYANKGRVFTKAEGSETFGLIEFHSNTATERPT